MLQAALRITLRRSIALLQRKTLHCAGHGDSQFSRVLTILRFNAPTKNSRYFIASFEARRWEKGEQIDCRLQIFGYVNWHFVQLKDYNSCGYSVDQFWSNNVLIKSYSTCKLIALPSLDLPVDQRQRARRRLFHKKGVFATRLIRSVLHVYNLRAHKTAEKSDL